MASGVPVLLAAPEGEASRVIGEDGAGVHIAPEDPAALADAVLALEGDPARCKAMAEKGLSAAPAHSREGQARHMARVLELAAAGRGSEASSLGPMETESP